MNRRFAIAALSVTLACTVSACGFRLRGSDAAGTHSFPDSMRTTYVQGDERSPIVNGLKRELARSDVEVTDDPGKATAIVRILDEQTGRRVLSVGSDGKVTEYQMHYSVSYQFLDTSAGAEPAAAQTLRQQRGYIFDSAGVLGSGDQEQTLLADMSRSLVQSILLRLRAPKP